MSDAIVSGWIYSAECDLRGALALAFLDDVCIGAGEVSLFRQDLADAGLSHGFLGFHFPISVPSPKDTTRVVVRLDGSDAIFLPPGAKVGPQDAGQGERPVLPARPGCLKWMRERGWLSQADYDCLYSLDQLGVYDFSLVSDRNGGNSGFDEHAEKVASELFQLHYMAPIQLNKVPAQSAAEVTAVIGELSPPPGSDVIVALYALSPTKLTVAEGSHRDPEIQPYALLGGIDYVLEPNRLLFLNAQCRFRALPGSSPGPLTFFYASSTE